MAYTIFTNCTRQEYESIVYSGDSQNRIRIWFNGSELPYADNYCEKLTIKSRIIPDDGSKRFSLDNFIAKEAELIMHNVNPNIIQGKVSIDIETLVNKTNKIYQGVEIGVFNIQDVPTTDKDKITIKLRDNAVKFDFYYNAQPLIESLGGSATKKQILNDICTKANIICDVTNFLGDNDLVGVYDNTITARIYISYLAEQAGCIAYITRLGHLQFFNPNNISVQKIPLNIVEKYEIGEPYSVERIVYEDGIRKFRTSDDDSLSTLYINGANPYMVDDERLVTMLSNFNNFNIDSLTTGKILGNPAIDPFDLIEIYGYYETDQYGRKIFINDENTIVAKTLANHDFIYRGNMTMDFNTVIGKEARTENVTISGTPTFQKYAKTSIDNINGNITLMVGQIGDRSQKTTSITQDIDGIQSQVELIADITDEQESYVSQVSFSKVLASEILELNIRPINNNISYLYPRNNLYPSNNLYSTNRKIRFLNTTTNEYHDYELPDDLLYYDANNYDEFTLNYTDKICQVTKKCKYNANGEVELLSTPITESFDYPESTDVGFNNGDYTLTILGYNQGYIKAKVVLQNDFTSQMATKVEMNSEISQTAQEINLEVIKKVGNDEVISKINQSAEQITIQANKVNIGGVITAINNDSSTTIDGNKITTGTLNADKIYGGTISASTINLSNTTLSPNSSTIGGWNIANSYLYNGGIDGNNGARLYADGRFYMKNNYGWINTGTGGTLLSGNGGTYPVVISDNFSTTLPDANDTIAIRAFNGTVHINSNYGVYANDTLLAGGSSKKMKQKIKKLSAKDINEIYNELKDLPRYSYDYKKQYSGQKNNYGFIIEDFENKKLGQILHVTKGENGTKYYSHNDLTIVNSIIIQELMKKIEKLEKEVEELKCKK